MMPKLKVEESARYLLLLTCISAGHNNTTQLVRHLLKDHKFHKPGGRAGFRGISQPGITQQLKKLKTQKFITPAKNAKRFHVNNYEVNFPRIIEGLAHFVKNAVYDVLAEFKNLERELDTVQDEHFMGAHKGSEFKRFYEIRWGHALSVARHAPFWEELPRNLMLQQFFRCLLVKLHNTPEHFTLKELYSFMTINHDYAMDPQLSLPSDAFDDLEKIEGEVEKKKFIERLNKAIKIGLWGDKEQRNIQNFIEVCRLALKRPKFLLPFNNTHKEWSNLWYRKVKSGGLQLPSLR